MEKLVKLGKKRTILISISILLVSIHSIYFYHSAKPEIEAKKIIQQLIRLLLTFGLLFMVYKGKNWAKVVLIILCSLTLLGVLISLSTLKVSLINKSPLFVMIFVYSVAIYHFGFSKSFRVFSQYQNNKSGF